MSYMKPYDIHLGNCLEVLKGIPDNSVDSIVTDPPYGLSFMGKKWDYDVPDVEVWEECLRVLKPGGHLLSFAGTRTQHRMAVRIEDAGFEIRDMIAWVYSSGFPKSMNLDRLRGEKTCGCEGTGWSPTECEVRSVRNTNVSTTEPAGEECWEVLQPGMQEQGLSDSRCQKPSETEARTGQPGMERRSHSPQASRQLRAGEVYQSTFLGDGDGEKGRLHHGASSCDGGVVRQTSEQEGSSASRGPQSAEQRSGKSGVVAGQSQPQTMGAWPTCGNCGLPILQRGLGTALKPALEPITVARKPFKGTVAANVLEWGTGAINIDGCRINPGELVPGGGNGKANNGGRFGAHETFGVRAVIEPHTSGRWPANLIHDGSDEVVGLFPNAPGQQGCSSDSQRTRANTYGELSDNGKEYRPRGDKGSASRFFYCAKTSRKDRGEANTHPTVKPTDLMAYLCRLVTPPGGVVLDPFMGSGSTGKAAMREGFRFIGIEMDADYLAIAEARIAHEAGKSSR